ncbi:MAG: glycosyltransferase family 39 protein [Candidatus Cloacimonetes bacterium]|nr:glycosyltransferase family 39 protein [Candidatus Cloacimonadota bacterium]
MFKQKINSETILILIIVVAIILRFINYFEIPFTHDEFSALFRLKFDNFSELINKGVKIDGHPAGIQVFLYYWTKLFGTQEWVVKLPFTIMGILSVYLIYLIGKKWFNETVGLISASYIASIQFTVMYSQIARPYISGMFFSLLMIYYWSNLIMHSDKSFIKNSFLFIISTSLCAYNHHFSLLFAAIVGISGIFFIPKKFRIKYILSGVMIFILYIPHLKIFYYQLNIGGVEGWLGKPHNDFLVEFIYYIFNYSIFVIALTLGIILFGLFHFKKDTFNLKLITLSFAWFIIPFLIGFLYSRYVNAVLQYSVLIFSFPLLFFILFGFIKKQNTKINFILVLVILLTNILTLIYSRKHYDIFYKSVYKQILTDYENIKKDNSHTVYIIDSHKRITDYYTSNLDIDTDFVNYSNTFENIKEFKNFLETGIGSYDKLYFGCLSSVSPNIVPLIQDYFPKIEIQNNYFGGTTYLFSKQFNETKNTIDSLSFDSINSKSWSSIDSSRIISINDSIKDDNVYFMNNDIEWGPAYSCALKDIMRNKNNFIDISVKVKSKDNIDEVILVGSLELNGKSIYWSGTEFNEFILSQGDNSYWIIVHHSIKLSDIYLKHDNIVLKIYIWNKGRKNFIINDFNIKLRKGNPIIYGLFEKI